MKLLILFGTMIALINQASAVCSKEYYNDDQRFGTYYSSSVKEGQTITVVSTGNKLDATIGKEGRAYNLAGNHAYKQRKALANFLGIEKNSVSALARAISANTDDGDLFIKFMYVGASNRPDYMAVESYAGGNHFGTIFEYKNLRKVAESSDGNISECVELAHKTSYITRRDIRSEKIHSNTYEDLDLFQDTDGDVWCYKGTQSGARNILYKLSVNTGIIDENDRLAKSFDESDNSLTTEMVMEEFGRDIIFSLEYEFPDELGYDFEVQISECK